MVAIYRLGSGALAALALLVLTSSAHGGAPRPEPAKHHNLRFQAFRMFGCTAKGGDQRTKGTLRLSVAPNYVNLETSIQSVTREHRGYAPSRVTKREQLSLHLGGIPKHHGKGAFTVVLRATPAYRGRRDSVVVGSTAPFQLSCRPGKVEVRQLDKDRVPRAVPPTQARALRCRAKGSWPALLSQAMAPLGGLHFPRSRQLSLHTGTFLRPRPRAKKEGR